MWQMFCHIEGKKKLKIIFCHKFHFLGGKSHAKKNPKNQLKNGHMLTTGKGP
jgi:hypothetical protein